MNKKVWLSIVLTLSSLRAGAQTLSFDEVWKDIQKSSLAIKASNLQVEAMEDSKSRASRHWLPRVYLDGRSYTTNDPGNSFFGILSQRSLQQADFSPDAISHPDAKNYMRGALGVDFALFEGGMKSAQVDVFKESLDAQKLQKNQIQLDQFVEVGKSYGSISTLERQKEKLNTLSDQLQKMIRGYQLGSKSNPVGYSGLLGMKALGNRLSAMLSNYEAQLKSHYGVLRELGLERTTWKPESIEVREFVQSHFSSQKSDGDSFGLKAQNHQAKAAEHMSKMERARYLPRVGLFAENSMFHGDRDTANAYTAGVYVQWSLFNPDDYGRYGEARLKAMAAKAGVEALGQQERAAVLSMNEQKEALENGLKLVNESDDLLVEQTKTTQTLFRNGSISALQMVEVLNRRVDLIDQQSQMELGLLQVSGELLKKEQVNLEAKVVGGKHYDAR